MGLEHPGEAIKSRARPMWGARQFFLWKFRHSEVLPPEVFQILLCEGHTLVLQALIRVIPLGNLVAVEDFNFGRTCCNPQENQPSDLKLGPEALEVPPARRGFLLPNVLEFGEGPRMW